MDSRKLILYISMSVDGYIATDDDDLSWLSIVEDGNEDYGYSDFLNTVDTYIVGRNTYETIMKLTGGVFPHEKTLECYVITRKKRESENGVVFYDGDIEALINRLKEKDGKNIYCDGGGQLVNLLMQKNLIDEYIISVIPVMLGTGKRLFIGGTPPQSLAAVNCKHYKSGLIQLHYLKK